MPAAPLAGKAGIDILIDPIRLGWYKTLRVLKIVRRFLDHITPREKVKDRYSDSDAEKRLFKYESQVIKGSMKPEELKLFEIKDGIYHYDSRFAPGTQFTRVDLDKILYLDTHEILRDVPVVLVESPVLYSFLMMVHLEKNSHSGTKITHKIVSSKM